MTTTLTLAELRADEKLATLHKKIMASPSLMHPLWLSLILLSHRYIACYKPALMLCSWDLDTDRATRKNRDVRATLANLGVPDGLHLVGRLDRDSEGLLLLTDDGQFTAQVLSEACHKRYWALVQGTPSNQALDQMRAGGLEIRGAVTRPPISVRRMDDQDVRNARQLPSAALGMDRVGTWMEVVLNEGRNRQVRKITTAAGHRTIRLCRVAIGKLELDLNLNPGDWNYINKEDVLEE
jgi:23S rRNA pseudouridine2457 synthase